MGADPKRWISPPLKAPFGCPFSPMLPAPGPRPAVMHTVLWPVLSEQYLIFSLTDIHRFRGLQTDERVCVNIKFNL